MLTFRIWLRRWMRLSSRIRHLPSRENAVALLVTVEWLLTTVPFLLSLWLCSLYRSVIAGWVVSGMKSAEKRAQLRALMGDADRS